jgi:hypothetical protein
MFSTKLKSGKEVTIDLYALTVQDVRSLLDVKKKQHEGDELLGKAVGMTADELAALPFPDYRKLTRFFWQCVSDPLKDEDDAKNSQSESTSA